MSATDASARVAPGRPALADLVAIARPEQWTKHIFILPGLLIAYTLTDGRLAALPVVAGLAAACLIASANYVLNEWLDAEFDRHHPSKGARPAAVGRLTPLVVYVEYGLLALAGLALSATLSRAFLVTAVLFLFGAVAYNVRPLRTKERVHLDIVSEAWNNPLRLLFGWFMVDPTGVPPFSLVLLYWTAGAFLMATKRLAEYRYLVDAGGHERAVSYRRSFGGYDTNRLVAACLLYGMLSFFFLAVFLTKYRAELVLSVPLFAWLFVHYFSTAMRRTSLAEAPEHFYSQPGVLPRLLALVAAVVVLSLVDIPVIEQLVNSRFTVISLAP
ncbi:MAG: UbiA family prenyltransferase [Vicinamibacterales bacterium]